MNWHPLLRLVEIVQINSRLKKYLRLKGEIVSFVNVKKESKLSAFSDSCIRVVDAEDIDVTPCLICSVDPAIIFSSVRVNKLIIKPKRREEIISSKAKTEVVVLALDSTDDQVRYFVDVGILQFLG